MLLHIETSTNVCSVALSHEGKCLYSVSDNQGANHAALLSIFIDKALTILKKNNEKPEAVSVSSGPGSYTGLRIGVSTAKGLCYGYGIPLIAVSTLEVLCIEALKQEKIPKDALLCPMIDARRMEVYTALYNPAIEIKEEISAKIIDENSFSEILNEKQVYFFGNGAEKCKPIISHSNAHFISNVDPKAENMITLTEKKIINNDFVDVAYFEPFYLKEFQTSTPKKKKI